MDFAEQAEVVGKVLLAGFCGGVVGWQRDRRQYVAGLRTMALVAAGAAMFTAANEVLGADRVVANIVTGIGFLGAGIISACRPAMRRALSHLTRGSESETRARLGAYGIIAPERE